MRGDGGGKTKAGGIRGGKSREKKGVGRGAGGERMEEKVADKGEGG